MWPNSSVIGHDHLCPYWECIQPQRKRYIRNGVYTVASFYRLFDIFFFLSLFIYLFESLHPCIFIYLFDINLFIYLIEYYYSTYIYIYAYMPLAVYQIRNLHLYKYSSYNFSFWTNLRNRITRFYMALKKQRYVRQETKRRISKTWLNFALWCGETGRT